MNTPNSKNRYFSFRYIYLFALVLFLSFSVSADTIAGISGIGESSQKDNTKGFDYDDWPQDIRDKCDEQLRSVIKTCAEKGYENWFVQRNYSGKTFAPQEKYWHSGDVVIGKEICGYSENSIDETFSVSSLSDYMCSNRDFVEETLKSEEYICSFTCSAWDCDEGSSKKEVAGCGQTPEKYPGQDPYERQGPGCAEGQELMCKERGKKAWWKFWGSSCELERPCYTKDFGGQPVVFCNCSCENKPFESTISESQVNQIIASAPELSANTAGINLKGCFPDITVASTEKDPVLIKVDTTRENAQDLIKLINNSPADAVRSGVLEGSDAARMAASINLANDPATSFNTVTIVTDKKDAPAENTPPQVSDTSASSCKEDWGCRPWSDWGNWSNCDGGVQFRFHSRQCTEKNNCKTTVEKPKTSESEKKGCGALDAQVSILVDGKPSQTFVADKNNQISVTSIKPLALPIVFTLVYPTPEKATEEVAQKEPVPSEFTNHLRSIILYKDDLAAEYLNPKYPANCRTPSECTFGLTDSWNTLLRWRTGSLKFDVEDNNGNRKEFSAGISKGPCSENWSCGEWSSWTGCLSGTQSRTRSCTDANNCATIASRPVLSESQSCQTNTVVTCTENWSCGEWVNGSWGACQENNTQSKTNTRTCTDAGNCGTIANKPATSQSESQSCTYSPSEQKPEYTQHESTLGSNIGTLNWQNGSASFDTSSTGGQYGYKILGIPSGKTVKICVAPSPGQSIGYNAYPQYPYGYDWSGVEWESANPGCITAYNKNSWVNGMLVHLGDPATANVVGAITVSEYAS